MLLAFFCSFLFNYVYICSMEKSLAINIDKVIALCRVHKVKSLHLFGSAVDNNLKTNSDIDFLVKFKPINLSNYFSNYMSLKNELKKLLSRDIDLVEEQTLKNPVLINSINRNKVLIYG